MKLFAAQNPGTGESVSGVFSEKAIPIPLVIAVIGVFVAAVGLAAVLLKRR